MFVKNCWYVAAELGELSAETPIGRIVIDEPLALFLGSDGMPIVFEDRCCHRWAPLSKGRVEDGGLRCLYHGFKYDASGACVEIPGQPRVAAGTCVRRYPAESRYGWVWVWMGEPERADRGLIPSTPKALGFETEYEGVSGQMAYRANYQLINDNLTDFTHLSFVHPESFGAGLEWAQSRPKVTAIDRGIRIQRWIIDDTITPRALPEYAGLGLSNWTSIDYLAPGVLLMAVEIYTPQARLEVGGGVPTAEPVHAQFNWQAVTPETESTSRYYFSWGVKRSENRSHLKPILEHVIRSAFEEDRQMIEGQQQIWDRTRDRRTTGSSGDAGFVRMRQTIQKMLDAERPGGALEAAARRIALQPVD